MPIKVPTLPFDTLVVKGKHAGALFYRFNESTGVFYEFKDGKWGTYSIAGRVYYNPDHSSKFEGNSDLGNGYYIWQFASINFDKENANQGGPDMRPAYPGAHTNAAGQLIYTDGVVQNYYAAYGSGYDAVFTDIHGKQTRLPGVYVTNQLVTEGAGMTLSSTIHLDASGNGLADLEHEYGHYLDIQNRFSGNSLYFFFQVGIPSVFSAGSESAYNHTKQPYEMIATRLAIDFFGPNSAIAQATKLYAR